MAEETEPIKGATVTIYTLADVQVAQFIDSGNTGVYKLSEIPEGDYYYKVTRTTKGTVIDYFTLPNPSFPEDVFKNISVRMVAGADIVVALTDSADAVIAAGVTVKVARIEGAHDGTTPGNYDVVAVPVGKRLLEVIPDDLAALQNLKYYIPGIVDTGTYPIQVNPPFTLQINFTDKTENLNSFVRELTLQYSYEPITAGTRPKWEDAVVISNVQNSFRALRQIDCWVKLTATPQEGYEPVDIEFPIGYAGNAVEIKNVPLTKSDTK